MGLKISLTKVKKKNSLGCKYAKIQHLWGSRVFLIQRREMSVGMGAFAYLNRYHSEEGLVSTVPEGRATIQVEIRR